MLIALFTTLILLFGGSDTVENYLLNIKKPVKATVQDKEKAKAITKLSKELGKNLKDENKNITKTRDQFLDLHQNYNATTPDFEKVLQQMLTEQKSGQKAILDTRFAMKELMTKEQWNAVFTPPTDD